MGSRTLDHTDVQVYVVDDDPAVRESLRWLMDSVSLPVAACDSAKAFLDVYHPDKPGCVVLDVRMPAMSGLELQDRMAAEGIGLPIIFITGHGDVPMAVRALKNGAVDFIEKPFSDQTLLDRIQHAVERSRRQIEKARNRDELDHRMSTLSPRERDVMSLVVNGNSNKAIAATLGLSPKTVEVHRARVMEKMQANSLPELVTMSMNASRN
ncbi:MAG: response regulator transcription factor [Planctomycetes bacterium]|nr:response regulator transcription factor [Planctomycetota bacterium]